MSNDQIANEAIDLYGALLHAMLGNKYVAAFLVIVFVITFINAFVDARRGR